MSSSDSPARPNHTVTRLVRHPMFGDVYHCTFSNGELLTVEMTPEGQANRRPTPVEISEIDRYTLDLILGDSGYVEKFEVTDLDETELL